jgi:DNA primase
MPKPSELNIDRDGIKEQVREATDIVELVGTYLSLRRQGRSLVGLCPWHDDSKPSLTVNPDRQTFRCWVCNIGGDVFSFLMKMERIEFPDALEQLASRAGIELARRSRGVAGGERGRATLLEVLDWARGRFEWALASLPDAATARDYAAARGLDRETVRRFSIGCAPAGWDWLSRQAVAAGISQHVLVEAGLAVERQDRSGLYDRFRDRLIFPIRDVAGRCIAFGGRALPGAPADTAKYINSPETPIFSKRSTLYGLDSARDCIIRSRRAIVVEGYTDCIAARQAGVEDVVAVLGTALGQRHVRTLRRYADRIVVLLDGDEAGRRRADEILDLILAEPIDVRIARLPGGVDPADLLGSAGREALLAIVDAAVDPLEYRLDEVVAGLPSQPSDDAVLQAIQRVLTALVSLARGGRTHLTPAAERLRVEQVLGRLSRRFGIGTVVLRERLEELRTRAAGSRRASPDADEEDRPALRQEPIRLPPWDREVLEVVVGVPGAAATIADEFPGDSLESPVGRALFETVRRLHAAGKPVGVHDLIGAVEDPALQSLIVEVDETGSSRGQFDPAARLAHLREALHRRIAARRCDASARQLRTAGLRPEDAAGLLEQLVAQRRAAQGISDPREG